MLVAIALANKMARQLWADLRNQFLLAQSISRFLSHVVSDLGFDIGILRA